VARWHRVNPEIIQAALAALPQRDRVALRGAAPALRDLTASIDAQAGPDPFRPAETIVVSGYAARPARYPARCLRCPADSRPG
jgi:hypothetical protein